MPEEPFAERLRRLASERGISLERVAHEAWDQDVRGTSPNLFKKVLRGERDIKPAMIEAVARALDVPPQTFPEYRLALARGTLDEREVGLDQALATLERFERALQSDDQVAPREGRQRAASRRRAQGGGSEPRSGRAT